MQADLAKASPRQAADQLLTRASEKCSKATWKYACDRLFIVFPDLASQFKHFSESNAHAFMLSACMLICRAHVWHGH